jgi:RNA polymerase sigma-B factor
MLRRYQRDGDLGARDALVEHFLPLAHRLARRYGQGSEPLEDLVQVASLGLLKALDRFDPDRGLRFSSYAVPTILGELKRHFRDAGWALHLARQMQERVLELSEAVDYLSGVCGASPSPGEIAEFLRLPVEDVLEAMDAAAAYDTVSLDAPTGPNDERLGTVGDMVGAIDPSYELVEHTVAMRRTLRAMNERDRTILYLRFAGDLTQHEIAERLGISQMHVSRLIRRSLDRLRVATGAGDAVPSWLSL